MRVGDLTWGWLGNHDRATICRPRINAGWLKKKGGGSWAKWAKRWFVLTDSGLRYYAEAPLAGQLPSDAHFKNVIPLNTVLRVATMLLSANESPSKAKKQQKKAAAAAAAGKFPIFLTTPHRSYELQATSAHEQTAWIGSIESRLAALHSAADASSGGAVQPPPAHSSARLLSTGRVRSPSGSLPRSSRALPDNDGLNNTNAGNAIDSGSSDYESALSQ